MDDIVPGSIWQTNRNRAFYVDVDRSDHGTWQTLPKGSIILVLARTIKHRKDLRFWLLIDGRPFYDTLPSDFLEPVAP